MDSNILMQQVQADGTLLGLLPQSKATNISIDTIPDITGDNVQEALEELNTNTGEVQTNLTNHINDKNNPHDVTAAQIGAATSSALNAHISDTNNPHQVTASQVGALPTTGGTLTGALNISGSDNRINFKVNGSATNAFISRQATQLKITDYTAIDLYTPTLTWNGNPIGGGGGDLKICVITDSPNLDTSDDGSPVQFENVAYNNTGGAYSNGYFTVPSGVSALYMTVNLSGYAPNNQASNYFRLFAYKNNMLIANFVNQLRWTEDWHGMEYYYATIAGITSVSPGDRISWVPNCANSGIGSITTWTIICIP